MGSVFAFLDNPAMLLILGAAAVLLFGERLPEVARNVGRGFMEFKKGVHGIQQEIRGAIESAPVSTDNSSTASSRPAHCEANAEDHEEATAPKFEPPPSA